MNEILTLLKEVSQKTDTKILLLVIDGVGGLPVSGKTELEAANTPNLDELAKKSALGLTDPVFPGITPGSGPGHLSLFGYDPIKWNIGRGVLEALGVGLTLSKKDIAIRGNFATIENGVITDRRAGRIPTEENKKICQRLAENIKKIEDVEILITPGKEHRFVLVLRGENLGDKVCDTDPQQTGKPPIEPKAIEEDEGSKKTAKILKKFVEEATKYLEKPANYILLRGISKPPDIPPMQEVYKIKPCAIATYPMYKGIAKLVGMDVVECGTTLEEQVKALKENWDKYDFFYFHVKKTDSMGEDGNFEGKVKLIEEVDKIIPDLLSLNPDVFVITGDHSTPCVLKSHSWHPNPFLLYSKYVIPDDGKRFTERECAKGILGRFPALYAMSLMLANALKLKKYGA